MLSLQCYGLFLLILGSVHAFDSVNLIFYPLNVDKLQLQPSYYLSQSLIYANTL